MSAKQTEGFCTFRLPGTLRATKTPHGGVKTPPYNTQKHLVIPQDRAAIITAAGPHTCGPYVLPQRQKQTISFPPYGVWKHGDNTGRLQQDKITRTPCGEHRAPSTF